MAAIRVLIVDDVARVRQDLRTALALAGNIEIVGEAVDGQEAIRQAERLRPDVVLMDLEMPVLDGYEAARQIKASNPGRRVIALTIHDHEAARRKAAEAGFDEFAVKGMAVQALVKLITALSAKE